jgi:glycosyltransferase involved in cell wall biosynthesis
MTTSLALVCDYFEEGWPSMDLAGEMISAHLERHHAGEFDVTRVCPPFCHRLSHWPVIGHTTTARNVDRLINRFWDYPHTITRLARRDGFDLYHLVDHSYSQLVHALPSDRVIVTCHDLDTFRCLLEPNREPRPRWFRAMAVRILSGFKRAAAIVCVSEATREALLRYEVVPAEKLYVVPNGICPEFSTDPDPEADALAGQLLGPPGPTDLLHVGSNIPRKRIDVLLAVFAAVRRTEPAARLIKAGGVFTAEQERLARELGVRDAVVIVPKSSREVLAAVYQRASLVLQPSEAEGFGLPVLEALACGVPLVASDIPALREVGGDGPVYRAVGDVSAWAEAALTLLDERRRSAPAWLDRRALGLARAGLYSWANHASQLAVVYREVLASSIRRGSGK